MTLWWTGGCAAQLSLQGLVAPAAEVLLEGSFQLLVFGGSPLQAYDQGGGIKASNLMDHVSSSVPRSSEVVWPAFQFDFSLYPTVSSLDSSVGPSGIP